ncbi:arylsulfatase [Lutibacter citreus]|uniref:arylsulfatase n=1 Tax=Lutibacter citreus TaxID=2138210 RepID=UPI000DBE228C|nr:arylsulfatase [Lutibacter citreus]
MKLIAVIITCLLSITLISCKNEKVKVNKKPNVIIILSDDQGYGDLGRHGHPILKTPNLDKFYDQSVRFTKFHVSPTCAPTRAALMTGKHEFKSGVTHTVAGWGREKLSLESTTLATHLKNAGYSTGLFGKWHLGKTGAYRAEKRGFDVALTIEGAKNPPKNHWDPNLMLNGVEHNYKGFRTDIFFNEATKWISEKKETPFFCYIPTYSPHGPIDAPKEFIEQYKGHGSGKYWAAESNIDWNVGKLMKKLKELGIDDNTLVIYMNDNGGTHVTTYNAGMRGKKATVWMGGTRAMSLWRWPKHFTPGDVDKLCGHTDVMPTIAELAESPIPDSYKVEGKSLLPLLKDVNADFPDRVSIRHLGRWPNGELEKHKYIGASVLWKNYRLIRTEVCGNEACEGECKAFYKAKKEGGSNGFHRATTTPLKQWNLFDVDKDPLAENDLAKEKPELVKKLSGKFEDWWVEVQPYLINDK